MGDILRLPRLLFSGSALRLRWVLESSLMSKVRPCRLLASMLLLRIPERDGMIAVGMGFRTVDLPWRCEAVSVDRLCLLLPLVLLALTLDVISSILALLRSSVAFLRFLGDFDFIMRYFSGRGIFSALERAPVDLAPLDLSPLEDIPVAAVLSPLELIPMELIPTLAELVDITLFENKPMVDVFRCYDACMR